MDSAVGIPVVHGREDVNRRSSIVVVMLGLSVLFVGLKVVEVLLTDWSSWTLNWRRWTSFVGFALAFFWYAVFVMAGADGDWFGRYRRLITGGTLGIAMAGVTWWSGGSPEAIAIAGALGIVAGAFADKWVEGI